MTEEKKQKKNVRIVVGFDGEFTGPFGKLLPNAMTGSGIKHTYMLAFGAYAMTVEKEPQNVEDGTFYAAMLPPPGGAYSHDFDPDTEAWFDRTVPQLKSKFLAEAEPISLAMTRFIQWLRALIAKYGQENIYPCCDSPTDSTWLNYYLSLVGSKDLANFGYRADGNDDYTGWPHFVDDYYRGYLLDVDVHGTNEKMKALIGYNPAPYIGPPGSKVVHHPTYDAYEQASLFATFIAFCQAKHQ